jgi:hypothetical protein
MSRKIRSCTLGAALVLSGFVPGCGQDNQKEAARLSGGGGDTTIVVPKDNLSPQERRLKASGHSTPAPSNYPSKNK